MSVLLISYFKESIDYESKVLNCNSAGGFNQPIMCGGEPRAMLRKDRGKADPPIYTIQICVPKHGTYFL